MRAKVMIGTKDADGITAYLPAIVVDIKDDMFVVELWSPFNKHQKEMKISDYKWINASNDQDVNYALSKYT